MYKKFVMVMLCVLFNAVNAHASSNVELEKIVVTPVRYAQDVQKVPQAVNLINLDDIENSNAQTIPDILKYEPGIVVRDYYGTGTKVLVDLRGFGEMAGLNTLVLVDGRRINEIDLSGIDWSQVPLDRVERIEVVRGGNSVLYGDNTTSGVINIITKTPGQEPVYEIETAMGSYDMNKQRVSVSAKADKLGYYFGTTRFSTHGYRKNSYFRSNDYSLKLNYDLCEDFSLGFAGGYNDADFGLPGALRDSQLKVSSRRDTRFSNDDVGQTDYFADLSQKIKLCDSIEFNSHLSFRRKRSDNFLWTSTTIDNRRNDTFGFTPSLKLNKSILGKDNELITGLDFYRADTMQDAYSYSGLSFYTGARTRETDIDKETLGYYLHDEVSLFDNLIFAGGYRRENAKYAFSSQPLSGAWTADPFWTATSVDSRLHVDEEAANFGLNYFYCDTSHVFGRFSKGYRFPAADEYYSLWAAIPVNTNILPQTFNNYELGLVHEFDKKLNANLTLFDMRIGNELYYDPLTYENKNYDKTNHRGIESGINWAPDESVSFAANYTFTEAFFSGGSYNHNQIPMVPYHKLSFGMMNKIGRRWQINTLVNYVGDQYFINDQPHNYPRLSAYTTVDTKVSYKMDNFSLYAGVNNLFNKGYSECGAISTVYSERGYYPSPKRNFVLGGVYKF